MTFEGIMQILYLSYAYNLIRNYSRDFHVINWVLFRLLAGIFTFFPFPVDDKYRVFLKSLWCVWLHLSLYNHAVCYRNVINHFASYLWEIAIGTLIRIKKIAFFRRLDFSLVDRNCVCDVSSPPINSLTASAIVVIKILSLQSVQSISSNIH